MARVEPTKATEEGRRGMTEVVEPGLTRQMLSNDPLEQFRAWFQDARERGGLRDPNAMCLSTVGADGAPQGRMVLLKDVGSGGFAFYTNLESAKGRALASNPRAALTFHWERLGRQVRVEGEVVGVDPAEADAYFASRPRESQLGAWVSRQSEALAGREELEVRYRELEARYGGGPIPRPPHWSGFLVRPVTVEFWQERPGRLHDRFQYRLQESGGWRILRLSP